MAETACSECGVANPAGTAFCLFCGAYLAWDTDDPRAPDDTTVVRTRPSTRRADPEDIAEGDEQPVLISAVRTSGRAAGPAPASPRDEDLTATPVRPARLAFVGPDTPVAAVEVTCPSCGRQNSGSLHFCARCGTTLKEDAAAPARAPTAAWRRMLSDRDRVARREYRRSLPPFYRWRRVIIGVLVPLLVLGGLVAVGRHPVRWAQQRWWDLRGSTVAVTGVTATTSPANASLDGSDPAALVDGTEQAWTEPWSPPAEGASCGGAEGTGLVVLTFAPTRIREIDITAGLPDSNANRPLEARPQAIGVRFDSGPCRRFTLVDAAGAQRLTLDSGIAVSRLSIGIDTTFPPRTDGRAQLSITEVGLRSRPS